MRAAAIGQPISDRLSGAPNAGARGAGHRWARFLAGALGILFFAFGVVPALQQLGPVREVRDSLQNANIDATALIYSESEESLEAGASIRNAIRYSPDGTDSPVASLGDGRDDSPAGR